MRWILDFFTRDADPEPSTIDALGEVDTPVVVCGTVECSAEPLRNPLDGTPAVVLHYAARVRVLTDQETGTGGWFERYQATSFLVRDESGVVRIEIAVEAGGSVAELHSQLIARYGAGHDVNLECIAPGDRVRVRGRVLAVRDGDRERDQAWTHVIAADGIEAVA